MPRKKNLEIILTAKQARDILQDCLFEKSLNEANIRGGRGYSKAQKAILSSLRAIAKGEQNIRLHEKKGQGGDLFEIKSGEATPLNVLNAIINDTTSQEKFCALIEEQIQVATTAFNQPEPWDNESIEDAKNDALLEINTFTALSESFKKLPEKLRKYTQENKSEQPAKTKNLTINRDMAGPLYKEVERLGRMKELKNLTNNPYPNAFSKVLEILEISSDKICFNNNDGYQVKVDNTNYDKIMRLTNPAKRREAQISGKDAKVEQEANPEKTTRPRR